MPNVLDTIGGWVNTAQQVSRDITGAVQSAKETLGTPPPPVITIGVNTPQVTQAAESITGAVDGLKRLIIIGAFGLLVLVLLRGR